MKHKLLASITSLALLVMISVPAVAHHGATAYELAKSTTMKGTVTGWQWLNPHCLLLFDAPDEKGEVQHWAVEMYNPLWMERAGWTKDTLKNGDEITITFHVAKNGTPNGYVREGDGKIVLKGKELGLSQQ
jgi:hypothetical protein